MDSARFAAILSTFLGAFAIVINLLAVPILFNKVGHMQERVKLQMHSFRTDSDQTWNEIIELRKEHIARYARNSDASGGFDYDMPYRYDDDSVSPVFNPLLRDSVMNRTNISPFAEEENNQCPAGPPGPPGLDGQDGLIGTAGQIGAHGIDARQTELFDEEMCSLCPMGPRGISGLIGPPGVTGKKGPPGLRGNAGHAAEKGAPGFAGLRGIQGIPGKPGKKGVAGKPAQGGKGIKGPKGSRGPIGRAGQQGESGNPSFSNYGIGMQGLPGKPGVNATDGRQGDKGPTGPMGFIGSEGGYCPCPKELHKYSQSSMAGNSIRTSSLLNPTAPVTVAATWSSSGQAPSFGSPSAPDYGSPGARAHYPNTYGNDEYIEGFQG